MKHIERETNTLANRLAMLTDILTTDWRSVEPGSLVVASANLEDLVFPSDRKNLYHFHSEHDTGYIVCPIDNPTEIHDFKYCRISR